MTVAPAGEDDRPIGVFDSGFGGLTVLRALIDLLPRERFVYVGDTGRYPYGPRPPVQVLQFSRQIATYLADVERAKMVVVACNTAASASLETLRAELAVPVVGVIEPGIRAALDATRNASVGVIGTVGTIASGAYQRAAGRLAPGVDVHCAACPGFVEFVERGETESDQVHVLAERLLAPLRDAGIDTMLLGCTHYPFLARTIGDVMGRGVLLVSSADETAFDVRRALGRSEPSPTGEGRGTGAKGAAAAAGAGRGPGAAPDRRHRFLSSGDLGWFVEMGRRLLGPELDAADPVTFQPAGRKEP